MSEKRTDGYETVIGLEVHVELATATKIFCGCASAFGGKPNSRTCPVCTGQPGTLPVFNRKVAEYAAAAGLALNCRINSCSRFDRKNYFYPDNPQNYQISQLYQPICTDGCLEIETEGGVKKIRIHEIHMEEDAGKLIHGPDEGISIVDYNRAGVPLIEIVSEPDMRSAGEAAAYLENLRQIMVCLGISDCRMNEGSMRADVNLSVRRRGERQLGTRTEMKNLNSFRAMTRAIEAEQKRQILLLEKGEKVVMETRRWDDKKGISSPMRSKEEVRDYRYFPEPDLVALVMDSDTIERIRDRQPELPQKKRERFRREYGISGYEAGVITRWMNMADLFEAAAKRCQKPGKVANWLTGETMRLLKEAEMEPEELSFSPENLAKLVLLVENKTVTTAVAKTVFTRIFADDVDPEEYVKKNGLGSLSDPEAIRETAIRVIGENPDAARDFRGGKKKAIGALVGQVMKRTGGRADPAVVRKKLEELLEKEGEE